MPTKAKAVNYIDTENMTQEQFYQAVSEFLNDTKALYLYQ
jgi:hypothetical protein